MGAGVHLPASTADRKVMMNALIWVVDGLRVVMLLAVLGGIAKLITLFKRAGQKATRRTTVRPQARSSDTRPIAASPLPQDK